MATIKKDTRKENNPNHNNEIKYCKYFIADLTYKIDSKERAFINGNVMFEIGMANL